MIEYIIRESDCVLATKQEIVGELVRCKDCVYRVCSTCYAHFPAKVYVREDDFCSRGRKKNEAD